jgi:pimeloyl-ACP methyl ester carboxylesterase
MVTTSHDVEICVETFGAPGDPALLLIPGVGGSMDTWDPEFCAALAEGGRYVVRYDLRDTGRSTHYPPGVPDYSFHDLLDDAVALIDRLAAGRAHLVGLSMGGGMAQYLAVHEPEKVASVTLVSTSPIFRADLPSVTPELLKAYAEQSEPDWSDPESVLDHFVRGERIHSGAAYFDEAEARERLRHLIARTDDVRTLGNHNAMKQVDDGPEPDHRALLAAVAVPTLVIHGTADPMFTQDHGMLLAESIPGAELLLLDGVGHQPPPRPTWDVVVPRLLRHTAGRPAAHQSPNTRRV